MTTADPPQTPQYPPQAPMSPPQAPMSPPQVPVSPPQAPMSPPQAPVSPRVGSAERQQAMDALDAHLSAGRLDPEEYGERVGRASVARTVADLEPLFLDLPAPHGPGSASGSRPVYPNGSAPPTPAWSAPAPSPSSVPAGRSRHHGREPLGGRVGEVAVALTPFIALALFFLTDWSESWLFFLLIPVVGVVVYGRDWHED